ncbi:MAG: Rne/Rng family ribonuclease [Acetobacter sp.]|nr:Rne/Rng family ribonuclease [Acetobacter sp.]
MKRMLIDDTQPEETRVVIVDGNKVEDVEFESSLRKQIKGNIFTAKVVRIEPSLQAAFVDYGGNRHGFLAFGEIHPDYYNVSDEIKAEVEKEVDEIIEKKRQFQAERKAEQERRRLEREQKRAEYEAKKLAEAESEAAAAANAASDTAEMTSEPPAPAENASTAGTETPAPAENASTAETETPASAENASTAGTETPASSETAPGAETENAEDETAADGCGCSANCACRAEDGHCHCEENGVCTCDEECHCSACRKEAASDTRSGNDTSDSAATSDTRSGDDASDSAAASGEASAETKDKPARRTRRRGTRFLGRRSSGKSAAKAETKDGYKVSAETAGIERGESVAEEIGEEDETDMDEACAAPVQSADDDDVNAAAASRADDDDDDFDTGSSKEFDNDDDDADSEHYLEIQRKLIFARKLYHRSAIQDVIREGQTLLIQIVKEERGNKGAACTTYLSLAGRYCVLMPNRIKSGGVSRKITSANDRKRLKDIMRELPLNDDMSLIIRTAGEDKQKSDIVRDYNYLIRTWNHIRHSALSTQAPALIYEEGNLIKRALRDMYTKDIGEVIIDGDNAYKTAKEFSKILSPNMGRKIKCRKPGEIPVFQHYQVEKELDKLHNPVVQLASGGYLVINPTEALVSIDVNSGRATREMDIEETALKTNLEAADEIAKQLRMRNLAGLVVVDFIDMEEPANNHAVEKRMKEAMKPDRARVQIAKMSIFGLLEISRQRMHSSFVESNYVTCPYCRGQGVLRSTESGAMLVLRAIEEEGIKGAYNRLEVRLPQDTAIYILNHKRRILADMEEKYGLEIIISADGSIKNICDYKIEKSRQPKAKPEAVAAATAYAAAGYAEDDNNAADDDENEGNACTPADTENGSGNENSTEEETGRRSRGRGRNDRRRRGHRGGRGRDRERSSRNGGNTAPDTDEGTSRDGSSRSGNARSAETSGRGSSAAASERAQASASSGRGSSSASSAGSSSAAPDGEPKPEKKTWWKKLIG